MTAPVIERPTSSSSGLGGPTPPVEQPGYGPRRALEPIYRPASAASSVFSMVLSMICGIIIVLLLNLVLLTPVQHSMSQKALYDQLRVSLFEGSAPMQELDDKGDLIVLGTPLALLSIPDINVNEVVVEGTNSGQTMQGAGHLRGTPMPGQPGTSVVMARSGAYGGVFNQLDQLKPGMRIKVTTGQGEATFQVIGPRRPGDPNLPTPKDKEGRLTLTAAAGPAFLPNDVIRVDARLISDPFPAGARMPNKLPDSEKPFGQDFSQLFSLVIMLQLLIGACMALAWCWRRWGKWQSWIVFIPILATLTILVGNQVNYLLPNLL